MNFHRNDQSRTFRLHGKWSNFSNSCPRDVPKSPFWANGQRCCRRQASRFSIIFFCPSNSALALALDVPPMLLARTDEIIE
jgi:hypothetical protein